MKERNLKKRSSEVLEKGEKSKKGGFQRRLPKSKATGRKSLTRASKWCAEQPDWTKIEGDTAIRRPTPPQKNWNVKGCYQDNTNQSPWELEGGKEG